MKKRTKEIEKAIATSLIDGLQKVIGELGKGTDKLVKKLAKRIAKEIKPKKATPVAVNDHAAE